MESIIATAHYLAVHPEKGRHKIMINIYQPILDASEPSETWRCYVDFKGFNQDQIIYGIDSLQALSLALQYVQIELKARRNNGWLFYFEDDINNPADLLRCYFPHCEPDTSMI